MAKFLKHVSVKVSFKGLEYYGKKMPRIKVLLVVGGKLSAYVEKKMKK